MADTGILVRGDTFDNIMLDKPIHREICITEKGLVIGYDSGSGIETFVVNLEAISNISKVALDGTITQGIKTSEIPLLFDGAGDLKVTTDKLIVGGNSMLSRNLKFIKTMDTNSLTLTDFGSPETLRVLHLDVLEAISAQKIPIISAVSTTQIALLEVDNKAVVVDEAETTLGTIAANGAITFSIAQTSGDRVYAYNIDISKNNSKRVSILIP